MCFFVVVLPSVRHFLRCELGLKFTTQILPSKHGDNLGMRLARIELGT